MIIDLVLYVTLIIASILLLIGIATYFEWLLLPWIFLMAFDIIRGIISVIFIFIVAHVSSIFSNIGSVVQQSLTAFIIEPLTVILQNKHC